MDLSDWKAAFIKLARGVTIDEVALVGASIHPISVDGSINQARNGGFDNWQTAELIARLLRDAVRNGELYVEEAYIAYLEGYTVVPGNKLQTFLRDNRSSGVQGAKFQGGEVWEWMAYHGFIDPKYAEPPRSLGTERIIRAMNADKEQSDQIAELKRQLAFAQDELAKLRIDGEQSADPRQKHIQVIKSLLSLIPEIEDNSPTRAHEIINTLLRERGLPELEVTDRTFRNWLNQG